MSQKAQTPASLIQYSGITSDDKIIHFQKAFQTLDAQPVVKFAAENLVKGINEKIKDSIINEQSRVHVQEQRKQFFKQSLFSDRKQVFGKGGQSLIQTNIRKAQLRDQVNRKKELEEKLKHLNQNIDILQVSNHNKSMQDGIGHSMIHRKGSLLALEDGVANTPLDKKEEMQKKLFEAQGLVKRLKQDQIERKKKQKERQNQQRQKLRLQLAKAQEMKNQKDEEAKRNFQERQWKLNQKLEKMKKDREARQKEIQEETKKIAQKKERLYLKFEKEFDERYNKPQLERRKKQLEEKRNISKPLNHKEWDSFARRADQLNREKIEQLKKIRRQKQLEIMERNQKSQLQSYAMQKMLQEQRRQKEQKLQIEKDRRQMIDRKKQYAEKVKDLHKPPVSEKKRLELQLLVENLKHPVRQPKRTKSAQGEKKPAVPRVSRKDQVQSEAESDHRPKKKKKPANYEAPKHRALSQQPKPPEGPKQKPTDYLAILKQQRLKKLEESGIDSTAYNKAAQGAEWGQALKDQKLSMKEKYDKITAVARQYENQALRMEAVQKHSKEGAIDKTEDINQKYVEAIRAKLALLQNL